MKTNFKRMIKNAPKSIFLVTGYEKIKEVDFSELFEVNWNSGKIYEGDLEYVSKNYLIQLLNYRIEKLKLERKLCEEGTMRGGQQKHRLAGIKKELEYLIKKINGE